MRTLNSFKHPDRRRFSRCLLLVLLMILPATATLSAQDLSAPDRNIGGPPPATEEVHPWDGDVLGFHSRVREAFLSLLKRLFAPAELTLPAGTPRAAGDARW